MKRSQRPRVTTIEEAIRQPDPLMAIESVIDEHSAGGQWFRLLFAAILEVNSAGPGILLDRFDISEVKRIASEYARIGATSFPAALRELINFAETRFGENPSEEQLMTLSADPEFEAIDRRHALRHDNYREEMERALITYISTHPDEVRG